MDKYHSIYYICPVFADLFYLPDDKGHILNFFVSSNSVSLSASWGIFQVDLFSPTQSPEFTQIAVKSFANRDWNILINWCVDLCRGSRYQCCCVSQSLVVPSFLCLGLSLCRELSVGEDTPCNLIYIYIDIQIIDMYGYRYRERGRERGCLKFVRITPLLPQL